MQRVGAEAAWDFSVGGLLPPAGKVRQPPPAAPPPPSSSASRNSSKIVVCIIDSGAACGQVQVSDWIACDARQRVMHNETILASHFSLHLSLLLR